MEQIKNRYGLAIEPGEFVQIQKEKCHILSYIENWEDAPAGTSGYRGVRIYWLFIDQKDLKKRLINDGSFAELESEYKQYFDEEPMTQKSFDHLIDSTLKPITLQQFIEGLPNLKDGIYFVQEAAPSAPTAHAPSPSTHLTAAQILSIVTGLARSQGFYGRVLREIQEREQEDPKAYAKWCKEIEALNFTDTLEVVRFFEECIPPKNALLQHDAADSGKKEKETLIGKKIRIIDMKGEPQYAGKEGVVTHIDDAGQIHGTWGGCALVDVDEWELAKPDPDHYHDDCVDVRTIEEFSRVVFVNSNGDTTTVCYDDNMFSPADLLSAYEDSLIGLGLSESEATQHRTDYINYLIECGCTKEDFDHE